MAETGTGRSAASYLGTGWSFPPRFVTQRGGVDMTSAEADIEASLRILLGTVQGERFLNPGYGLDMHNLLFEEMSTTMRNYLKDRIRNSILIYEPRIDLVSLELSAPSPEDGKLGILMEYSIRGTNSRYNLVYTVGPAGRG